MEHTLEKIAAKPSDYTICKVCGRLNWYENTECVDTDCSSDILIHEANLFQEWIDNEYNFWLNEEGYMEEEADEIFYDI